MVAELVFETDGKRLSYPLEKDEVLIGRSPDNDVIINDGLVSRQHAKVYRVGRSWRVKDLGSSNGTRLNGLDDTTRDLRDGDRINIHRFEITFVDRSAPGFALTQATGPDAARGTVFRSAVDFAALASIEQGQDMGVPRPGAGRLERLLDIVTKASEALLSSTSLDETLNRVLDLVFEHLDVERGCIMLWDEDKQDLVVKCVKQKTASGADASDIRFSRTIAEKVYREKVAVLTSDAQSDSRFAGGESIVALGIRSAMAAPLWTADRVEGLIYADTPLRVKAFGELDIDLLSALGNHAAVAIRQSRMQDSIMEQQLVRQRLERYHSPAVIDHITALGDEGSTLVAHDMEVTVMFADMVGFTSRCEAMEPRAVADLLNRYFSEMAEAVFRHEGTLDKFIGDCLMAVFGAPLSTEDHARRGVEAALDMRTALKALNEPLPPEARLEFRVGIHSGRVVAGDIGSVRRSDYTVLGSTVNLAARLESSVAEPGQIVLSDATLEAVGDAYETAPIGKFQPKGISREVRCYALLRRKPKGQDLT